MSSLTIPRCTCTCSSVWMSRLHRQQPSHACQSLDNLGTSCHPQPLCLSIPICRIYPDHPGQSGDTQLSPTTVSEFGNIQTQWLGVVGWSDFPHYVYRTHSASHDRNLLNPQKHVIQVNSNLKIHQFDISVTWLWERCEEQHSHSNFTYMYFY